MKTVFCVEFVRKCIYCGFWNAVVYVYDIIVRYNGLQKHFRFTKSSGNLEILTSIFCDQEEYVTSPFGVNTLHYTKGTPIIKHIFEHDNISFTKILPNSNTSVI